MHVESLHPIYVLSIFNSHILLFNGSNLQLDDKEIKVKSKSKNIYYLIYDFITYHINYRWYFN